jgi:translation initiation factor 4G
VVAGIEEVFDALRDKDEAALLQLLVALVKEQAVQVAEFTAGLKNFTATLEDFTMDIPKAPGVLGRAVGMAAAEGLVPLNVLSELLEGTEGAEGKRKLLAAAFKAVTAAGGEAELKELAAEVPVAELAKADEFDGDLPSVADWAKKEGFAGALKL